MRDRVTFRHKRGKTTRASPLKSPSSDSLKNGHFAERARARKPPARGPGDAHVPQRCPFVRLLARLGGAARVAAEAGCVLVRGARGPSALRNPFFVTESVCNSPGDLKRPLGRLQQAPLPVTVLRAISFRSTPGAFGGLPSESFGQFTPQNTPGIWTPDNSSNRREKADKKFFFLLLVYILARGPHIRSGSLLAQQPAHRPGHRWARVRVPKASEIFFL